MAGANNRSGGSSRSAGAKNVAAPRLASSTAGDRFRAASAAARGRTTRAVSRAAERGYAQARAAGAGYQGTVTLANKQASNYARRSLAGWGTTAQTTQFNPRRTPRQQRSIDRTSAAVRFYGLGTVTRGRRAREFGPARRRSGYQAPATRLF